MDGIGSTPHVVDSNDENRKTMELKKSVYDLKEQNIEDDGAEDVSVESRRDTTLGPSLTAVITVDAPPETALTAPEKHKLMIEPEDASVPCTAKQKQQRNISLMMIPVAFAANFSIVAGQSALSLFQGQARDLIKYLEIPAQSIAALMMLAGIYQEFRRPILSKWLQNIGQLLSLLGIIFVELLFLQMPLIFIPFPLLFIAALISVAFIL